jgi:Tfp pilus assembly protein PilO
MTRSIKLLAPILILAAAVAAFYFLVLAPKYEAAGELGDQIEAKQAEVAQVQSRIAAYGKARTAYRGRYAQLIGLGKAVPADDDLRSLMIQLDDAADGSKVRFKSLSLASTSTSSSETSSTGTATPPPGAVAGNGQFWQMPFALTFVGSYPRLTRFLDRMADLVRVTGDEVTADGRLLVVDSVSLAPAANQSRLSATVNASSYVLAPTAADTTGTTSDAAAASAAADSGSATSTAAAATPATATGVAP